MDENGWIFIVLGFFGALLTSTSWVPQIVKGYKTRRLEDLSFAMLGVFGAGTLCWLFYGLFREDWLIIGANSFISLCIGSLVVMKLLFKLHPSDRG